MRAPFSLLKEIADCWADAVGALDRGQVAAARYDIDFRLRDKLVHLLSLLKRHDVIELSPDDEDRHFELRKQAVGGVAAGKHGVERATHDPSIAVRDAENVVRDERRHLRRVRHEEGVELIEFGG